MGAGGVSAAGWPGHLCCGVGVSVGGGRKGHGSTGVVLVLLVLEFRLGCGAAGSGEGGEGSERRPVGELVVGECVVQLPRIYRVGCGVQRCPDCSAPEDQQVHRSLGFSDQLMSGVKWGTLTKADCWSIQTTFYKQLLYLYCGTTRGWTDERGLIQHATEILQVQRDEE